MKKLKRIRLLLVSVVLCLSISSLSVQSVFAGVFAGFEASAFRLKEENCLRGSLTDVESSVYITVEVGVAPYFIDKEKTVSHKNTDPYWMNFTRDQLVDIMCEVLYENPTYY